VREETRRQRYDNKLKTAKKYPISLCSVNFSFDDNLGYLIRSAACFGAERVYVIGHVPPRSELKALSGSLIDYVEIVQLARPSEFLTQMEVTGTQVISAELAEGARPLSSYSFDFSRHLCMVVGNEQTGVPPEILQRSDVIYVKMSGVGYCLNTAQTANILLYEAVNQYDAKGNL